MKRQERLRRGLVLLTLLAACHERVAFDQGGCDQDLECGLSTLHCDPSSATCVECITDDHCAALGTTRIRCDMAVHRCVECGLDADCGQGRACRSRHCVTLCGSEGPNAACPTATPYCEDDDGGFCVQCDGDLPQACTMGAVVGPICGRLGTCVACQADSDCHAPTARCDTFSGKCVACLSGADCTGGASICDPANYSCVASS